MYLSISASGQAAARPQVVQRSSLGRWFCSGRSATGAPRRRTRPPAGGGPRVRCIPPGNRKAGRSRRSRADVWC